MKTLLLSFLVLMSAPPQAPSAAATTVRIICPECNGEGVVGNGETSAFVSHWDTCPICHGAKYLEGILVKPEPPALKPRAAAHTESMLILSETGCAPCARLRAELLTDGMAADYPRWDIYTDDPPLVKKYGVSLFPTIILIRNGREVARRVGYASPAELRGWAENR